MRENTTNYFKNTRVKKEQKRKEKKDMCQSITVHTKFVTETRQTTKRKNGFVRMYQRNRVDLR